MACQGCQYLDCNKKMVVGKAYLYGCNLRQEGYVTTWINTDTTLDHISCRADKYEDDEDSENDIDDSGQLQGQMNIMDFLGG